MSDILVRLYDIHQAPTELPGVIIRRPMTYEKDLVKAWIAQQFNGNWANEWEVCFRSSPPSALLAIRDRAPVGFACFDGVWRGMFGPTGVMASERGKGIGRELLLRAMLSLRELGYPYASIGCVGPTEFYLNALPCMIIPGSEPGPFPPMLAGADAACL